MTLLKSVLVALSVIPLTAAAAVSTPQSKSEKPCDERCGFWSFDEAERFFSHPYSRITYSSSSMKESDKAYLISIDLPGMDKKDIKIEAVGNRLIITGERKEESQTKESSKKSYRQFHQSFSLPEDANLDAITATSTNGVLKITVPKTAAKKAAKTIEIK